MTDPGHIGQYRILGKLGAGGMGTVYLGEHVLLGRRAAIKTLLPRLAADAEVVERFFTEARATSAIDDRGVVSVFDFGYHVDGTAFIVMELLEGESLGARIERLGRIAPRDALAITRQVAGSLDAAHARGIIHRDLKPDNVFLIPDPDAQGGERTKILDFGICKLRSDDDPSVTQTGMTMGTPVYMSPEQCRGAGPIDHRSDIYALGCVLFHMVVGHPPFLYEGPGELLVAHLQEAPPVASALCPELPVELDALLARCLAKPADDRPASMRELQQAIDDVLARLPTDASGARAPHTAHPVGATPVPTRNLRAPLLSRPGPVAVAVTPNLPWWFSESRPTHAPVAAPPPAAPAVRLGAAQRATLVLAMLGAVAALVATLVPREREPLVAPPLALPVAATPPAPPAYALAVPEPAPPIAVEPDREEVAAAPPRVVVRPRVPRARVRAVVPVPARAPVVETSSPWPAVQVPGAAATCAELYEAR